MSRRDVVGVEEHSSPQKEVELDLVVAGEAGVGGAAMVVLAAEVVDDVGLKLALEVLDVVGHTDRLADLPGVLDVLHRAATPGERWQVLPLGAPESHRDADYVVPQLLQKKGGDGGVHPSAHGDDHSTLAHIESLAHPSD